MIVGCYLNVLVQSIYVLNDFLIILEWFFVYLLFWIEFLVKRCRGLSLVIDDTVWLNPAGTQQLPFWASCPSASLGNAPLLHLGFWNHRQFFYAESLCYSSAQKHFSRNSKINWEPQGRHVGCREVFNWPLLSAVALSVACSVMVQFEVS